MDDMTMTTDNADGFLSMADRLADIIADEVEALSGEVRKEWLSKVISETPVDCDGDEPGKLKRGWRMSQRRIDTRGRLLELSNAVEYVVPVEFGHRIVRNGKVFGYVKGRYFFTRSTKRVLKGLPKRYKAMGARIQRRLGD